MESDHGYQICLGIPVPRCVQVLPCTPPVSFYHQGDIESLELLRNFGKHFACAENEINHACYLASGPSDVVVILQRPKPRKYHNYDYPFPQFVDHCETLRAVDQLIQYATNGARSIHTVTVLDAFSFKPNKDDDIPDEECHQLLAEILRRKMPKIVIRCHTDEYKDPWMKQFELAREDYKLLRKEIQVDENHTITVLQSFHPAIAVYHAKYQPEYRCLLIYHFIAAFSELSGASQLNEAAEEIRKLCVKKRRGGWDQTSLSSWYAPIDLIKAFEQRYGDIYPIRLKQKSDRKGLKTKGKILSEMYDWLRHLAGPSCTFGALGIAKAIVFLWKEHFTTNPLYKQITLLLLFKGSQLEEWFPMANHELPIEEKLSKLQITSPELSGLRTVALSSDILEANKNAITCISTALPMLADGEEAACSNIAHLVEKQNLLINEHIRKSSLLQLDGALIICEIVAQCEILVEIINSGEYLANVRKEEKREDFTLLLAYQSKCLLSIHNISLDILYIYGIPEIIQ
ncbi:hypothetical protein F5884DRAFT_803017 [Xylogone sp. PMI_703]|nr:hypothetical protein F5884DRAFT_803017 [Xylogone sp. PMI_703]